MSIDPVRAIGIILILLSGVILAFGHKNFGNTFLDRFQQRLLGEKAFKRRMKYEKWVIGIALLIIGIMILLQNGT